MDDKKREIENVEVRSEILDELADRHERTRIKNALHIILFVLGFILILTGIFFWLQTELTVEIIESEEYNSSYSSHRQAASNIKFFGSFLILISTVVFSYLYMAGFNPRKQRENRINNEANALASKEDIEIITLLRSLNTSIEKGKLESVLSERERSEVINKISETVESQLNESLLSKIEEKYGLAIYNEKLSKFANKSLSETVLRLNKYVEDLKHKATVNLSYGIGATISAIMILIFILFNATLPNDVTQVRAIFFYTSRLFLVFLVQGIAVFFLNLYKTTLNNILYITNEITNHEIKRDSLAITLNTGNKDAIASMLISLANTERNFILKKGETSIYDKGGDRIEPAVSTNLISESWSKIKAK